VCVNLCFDHPSFLHLTVGQKRFHKKSTKFYSAKRCIAIACRLSVRLSLRLSVCNLCGSGSHRLEILETVARTISSTHSLFVAQTPSTYSQGKVRKFWGEVGKSGVLEHKIGNISETHENIEEKLPCRAYRNSVTLFRTVPSSTPYGLFFPKIGGSQPTPKISIAIISGTLQIWPVH